jgi:hypothetical protein
MVGLVGLVGYGTLRKRLKRLSRNKNKIVLTQSAAHLGQVSSPGAVASGEDSGLLKKVECLFECARVKLGTQHCHLTTPRFHY